MKIASIRIQNLRTFKDVTVPVPDYCCLVGANGVGKSSVLTALNIFFKESSGPQTDCCTLGEEDFHCKDTTVPIAVTLTFSSLTAVEKEAFKDYFRQDKLIITAEAKWDANAGFARVSHFGERMTFPGFNPYYDALRGGAAAPALKEIYSNLQRNFSLPAATTKPTMAAALEKYATEHAQECEPLKSEDDFYGFQGASKLPPFLQWVYIPAVKDATFENVESKQSALGKLLSRAVKRAAIFEDKKRAILLEAQQEYSKMLEESNSALNVISQRLSQKIQRWAHPDAKLDLQWKDDPNNSVKVAEPTAEILAAENNIFRGNISRFGHGFQRSFLLALLQDLAETAIEGESRLIIGCEEPELYQHPPQARHLASIFKELAKINTQVIVCTHSPHFVSGEDLSEIRIVHKDRSSGRSDVRVFDAVKFENSFQTAFGEKPKTPAGRRAKLHAILQPELNEMFFTRVLVLVEGSEDRAYISACLEAMGQWGEFRRLGCHIIPANRKSNLGQAIAIAQNFSIPYFVVFDADGDCEEKHKTLHVKDNNGLLKMLALDASNPFPTNHVFAQNAVVWKNCIADAIKTEIGDPDYSALQQKVATEYGHPGGLEKNELAIADFIDKAQEAGKLPRCLSEACAKIMLYINSV